MITKPLAVVMAVYFVAAVVKASPTVTWNETDWTSSSVTYSGSIGDAIAWGQTASLTFDKFNSEAAATALGQAGTYTLTKVVLSINGTIAGTFTYQNTESTAHTVYASGLNSEYTKFTLSANSASVSESYNYTVPGTPFSVAANSTEQRNYETSASGATLNITDALTLANFVGYDTYNGTVGLTAATSGATESGISTLLTASGDATFSVTYYFDYTPVPEPNTVVLLGLGCIALLIRRRSAC